MVKQVVVRTIAMFIVFALVMFGAAGTVAWIAGWVFLALYFGFTIAIGIWLYKTNPALLQERVSGMGNREQKTWDKIFSVVAAILFLTWLAVMPLDAVRFRWSHVPAFVQVAGAIALLWSFYLLYVVMRENTFLSSGVRVQSERGHTVVSTGPYARVRHPMYAATIVMLCGATLLLGSLFGLLVLLVLVIAIAFRAVHEEQTLRAGLPGYDEYMTKVRYRFVPYVW